MQNVEGLPRYARLAGNLHPAHPRELRFPPGSLMFTIRSGLKRYEAEYPETPVYDLSQGDGGSLKGVTSYDLTYALRRYQEIRPGTTYGSPDGTEAVRQVILERYLRPDVEAELTPGHVVLCDGGRDGLQKWCQYVQHSAKADGGVLVASSAPWISYMHGPYLNGLNVMLAPPPASGGFGLSFEGIQACVRQAEADGRVCSGLIITTPDNPTGETLGVVRIASLVVCALAHGVENVLVDLMYQAITDEGRSRYDVGQILSAVLPAERHRVTFLDGLTKSAGLSNVRSAFLVCGGQATASHFTAIASHSVLPNLLGEACAYEVYSQADGHPWMERVRVPTAESRVSLGALLTESGIEHTIGQGYYAFLKVREYANRLSPDGSTTKLAEYLTANHGVAVVPGDAFCQPGWIRLSYANPPAETVAAFTRLREGLNSIK